MSQPPAETHVAVFGLGIIGSRAANHIARAGYQVRTWNRTPKNRPDYEVEAAVAAEGADILCFYLKDVPAVREVFAAIAPVLGPGKCLVNHATIDLDTTTWLAESCAAAGCEFLNAPFTGSKVAASEGKLSYYAGGPAPLIARLTPFLEASSARIVPLESPTAATVVKLTTNLISASTVQALAEALRINQAFGNAPELFIEAVGMNACSSPLATMKLPTMAAGDFEAHFSLSNMLKDARYALDLARRSGLDTPGIDTTARQMQKLTDAGFGDEDFSTLYRQFASNDS